MDLAPSEGFWRRASFYLTFGSAVASLFSIAVCQILIALAFAALLLSTEKLRLPPIRLPLALFILGTFLSLAASSDPVAGRPQIRKFYVFLILLLVYSTFRRVSQVRALLIAWMSVMVLSSLWSIVQFSRKVAEAHAAGISFYDYYTPVRITGFMSHWMTLGGQQMMVLLMLGAFLFFSPSRKRWLWPAIGCAALIAVSIVLGFTRTIIFAATPAGAAYLLWIWNRRLLLLAPVAAGLLLAVNPASLRERFSSLFRPRDEVDSNTHRIICWRTGVEMIRAHPVLGLGPEMVNKQFMDYVPADIPRPLPIGWYGHLHNIYLQYAAERGIPVLLVLLWLIGKVLRDFWRALRKIGAGLSDEKFILHGAIAAILGTLVGGLFEFNLGDSEVLTVFLAVIACGYVAADRAAGEERV